MPSTDIIVRTTDNEPKRKIQKGPAKNSESTISVKLYDSIGNIHSSSDGDNQPNPDSSISRQSEITTKTDKVVKIMPSAKEVRHHIVTNWRSMTSEQIVNIMRKLYQNIGTLSSQLSNLKQLLSSLPDKPSEEYMSAIKLTRKEYQELNRSYKEKRDKEGFNLQVVPNADGLVTHALQLMTSNHIPDLWGAAILCSGLRPVELMTIVIATPENKHGAHDGWWVCLSGWAKKGQAKSAAKRSFCRDHPLLCPSWLFVKAVKKLRTQFMKDKLNKRQLHQRYAKTWLSHLKKAFPQLVEPTHVLLRRFYAKYSFLYFKDDFPNVIGENSYIMWSLGHTSQDAGLSYANLQLGAPAGKIKLFDIGTNLKIPTSSSKGDDMEVKHDAKIKKKRTHPASRPV